MQVKRMMRIEHWRKFASGSPEETLFISRRRSSSGTSSSMSSKKTGYFDFDCVNLASRSAAQVNSNRWMWKYIYRDIGDIFVSRCACWYRENGPDAWERIPREHLRFVRLRWSQSGQFTFFFFFSGFYILCIISDQWCSFWTFHSWLEID